MPIKKITLHESFWAWVFILPALLGSLIFIVLPIIGSFLLSFANWNLISPIKFAGLQNYAELFQDKVFWQVLGNTINYALWSSLLSIAISLVLAVALNEKIRGAKYLKTAYFIPYITPMIVIGVVWTWIFDPNFGLLNWLLGVDDNIKWLYDKDFAMPALIIVSVWKNIGYNMIIFLAGLSAIPDSVHESCKIEGAQGIKKFFLVTLPLLSPTVFFVSVMTTISSFQVFDLIYVMTEGGPQNSTTVLVYWLYKEAFEFFHIGKASAIAYVLFGIILLLTYFQWSLRKKWVFNE